MILVRPIPILKVIKVTNCMQAYHTEVLSLHPLAPEPSLIERAATLLRTGNLVVFPTETVYGLGADALQPNAVERIFAAKGRPLSDPLIVHIAENADIQQLVTHIPPEAERVAEAFWPGPLTLILPASPRVPKVVTANLPSVAIRMPRHPIALALIRAVGSPLAAPSANRFMHISPTTAQHALADLHGRVPLILDGGPCEVGVESTVLDLSSSVPTILRPGGVSREALQRILPDVQLLPKHTSPTEESAEQEIAQKSPGQMRIHYSPSVPALLFEGSEAFIRTTMLAEIHKQRAAGLHVEQVGLLIADEDRAFFEQTGTLLYTVGSTTRPAEIAARLYAGLHTLEDAGVQIILCRSFDEQGLGLAIRDRLLKATGGNVYYEG